MKKQTKPKGEKKPKKEPPVVAQGTRPFPVPPSGCPEGYYESGGQCILDS